MIKKLLLFISLIILFLCFLPLKSNAKTHVELLSNVKADSTYTLEINTLIDSNELQAVNDSVNFLLELTIDNQVILEKFNLPYFKGFVVISKYVTNLKAGKHKAYIRVCDNTTMGYSEGSQNFTLEFSDINDIRPYYSSMTSIYRTFGNTLNVSITGLADSVNIFLDKTLLGKYKLSDLNDFSVDISNLEYGDHNLKVKSQKYEKNFAFVVPFSFMKFIKTDYKRGLKALKPLTERSGSDLLNIFSEMRNRKTFSDSLFSSFWENAPMPFKDYESLLCLVDQNFYCWKEFGWETDMGINYIKWGPPDDVATYENGFESIIVWSYASFNRKIYFTRKSDAMCYIEDPFGEITLKNILGG